MAGNEELIDSVRDYPTITRLSHITQIQKIQELRDALIVADAKPCRAEGRGAMTVQDEFGRDLHDMGVTANFDPRTIADFMVKRGWTKRPEVGGDVVGGDVVFEPGAIVVHGIADPRATAQQIVADLAGPLSTLRAHRRTTS